MPKKNQTNNQENKKNQNEVRPVNGGGVQGLQGLNGNNPRGSVFSEDYLNQGKSRIPGWNNQPQNQPSPTVTQPLTEEERLKQDLSIKEHYLENLQNLRGGSANDIIQRKINIQATEKEIDELKLKLGLITQEEIDAKQREEKLKELERNKEELRSSERALSHLKDLPEAKNEGERITRRNQIRALEKNIERLQRLVPEAERLPINDEENLIAENIEGEEIELENINDEVIEPPKEKVIEEPEQPKELINEEQIGQKENNETVLQLENNNADANNEANYIAERFTREQIDNFGLQLKALQEDPNVTKKVIAELTAILNEAGVKNLNSDYIDTLQSLISHSMDVFALPNAQSGISMHDLAEAFFDEAYFAISGSDLSPRDHIIAAQKVANLAIKNYSPIVFLGEGLERYTDNYMLNNTDLLKIYLSFKEFSVEEIEKLVQEVSGAEVNHPEKDNAEVNNEPVVQQRPQNNDLFENDDLIDISKDPFIERLEKRNAEQAEIRAQEGQIKDAFEDDDFIDSKNDPFIERLEKRKDEEAKLENEKWLNERQSELEQLASQFSTRAQNYKVPEPKIAEVGKVLDDTKLESKHKLSVFINNLASFNSMYKLDIKAEDFNKTITSVWSDLTSGDTQKIANGKKTLNEFFKSTLQPAIAVEKSSAYKDQRMPDLNEVIISTNDLFRASMFTFTDLYHNPDRKGFYKMTAFGGFDAKELAEIAVGDSSWKMDQRSNKAWDVQSREAKDLADKWLKEDKPYEKMLNEVTNLVNFKKQGVLSNREAYTKLAAAEWMLINNEKMMVENPDDPLNPIPNWGNRYWRTLSETREALGIPRHTSMRELIQGNYEEIAKATENKSYNAKQLEERVFASEAIGVYDSYEAQMVEFATQSAAHSVVEPTKDKADGLANTAEEDYIRRREPVTSEDERENMKRAPKVFSNWVVERASELTVDTQREDFR